MHRRFSQILFRCVVEFKSLNAGKGAQSNLICGSGIAYNENADLYYFQIQPRTDCIAFPICLIFRFFSFSLCALCSLFSSPHTDLATMAPPKFDDIGKAASDLFGDDFGQRGNEAGEKEEEEEKKKEEKQVANHAESSES